MINLEVNQMGQCYIPSEGRALIKTKDDNVIELLSSNCFRNYFAEILDF